MKKARCSLEKVIELANKVSNLEFGCELAGITYATFKKRVRYNGLRVAKVRHYSLEKREGV